jgi:hypothetical protein
LATVNNIFLEAAEMRFYGGQRDDAGLENLFKVKVSTDVMNKFFEGRLQWIKDTWAEMRTNHQHLPADILAGAIAICLGWGENGGAAVKKLMMPSTDNTNDRHGASGSGGSGSGSMDSSFSFSGNPGGGFGGEVGGGKIAAITDLQVLYQSSTLPQFSYQSNQSITISGMDNAGQNIQLPDYTINQARPDGNCMFWSVLGAGIDRGLQWARELEQQAIQLQTNGGELLRSILARIVALEQPQTLEEATVLEMYKGMQPVTQQRVRARLLIGIGADEARDPRSWAQRPEAALLDKLFNIQIAIVSSVDNTIVSGRLESAPQDTLFLYWRGAHFDWLTPPNDPPPLISNVRIYQNNQGRVIVGVPEGQQVEDDDDDFDDEL